MKGASWGLLIVSACACFCVLAVLATADDASGATTYVDGDWYINASTTLSDGTWVVNGSVRVHSGVLTLDRAELVLNSPSQQYCLIWVNRTGGLQASWSTIRGAAFGLRMEIWGDSTIDNTTLDRVDTSNYAIIHYWGRMVLDHCRVNNSNRVVMGNATVVIRSCEFANFSSYAVYWHYSAPASIATSLLVEDTTFRNMYTSGYGVYVYGPGTNQDLDRRVVVRRCTFDTLSTAVYIRSFTMYGSAVIEDNHATLCSRGAYIYDCGQVVRLSGNSWSMGSSGNGMEIYPTDEVGPSVHNETLTGGYYSISISSSYMRLSLWDVSVSGANYGIYSSNTEVEIHSSRVRATECEFYVTGSGYIHIFDCDHTYSATVASYYGHVSEPVIVNVTTLTWQEGTTITSGVVYFENETGYIIDLLELRDPAPVNLPTWLRTYDVNITMDRARGNYSKDDWAFHSDWIALDSNKRVDLVIWDDFTPELNVTRPADGDMFDTNALTLKGHYVERGVGMGTVRVGYQGGNWTPAQVFTDDGTWQVRLEGLPDGLLTFTVNVTDAVGNQRLVDLANITVDTVWPSINVIEPGKYVRTSMVELLARTEPGAQAFVNYKRVEVMPDGMFSAMLAFTKMDNEVHIRVVDRVGHENYTIRKVYYDIVPPSVELEEPEDGVWTSAEEVTVKGFTEMDALVEVNGGPAELDMGKFSVTVPLAPGTNVIQVNVTDKAGNLVTLARTLHVDRAPPDVAVTSPAEGLVTTGDRVVVTGTVADESAVTVLVEGFPADMAEGQWSKAVLLEEGDNQVDIIATDGAGNVVRLFRHVHMDTTPPAYEATLQVGQTTYGDDAGTIVTQEALAKLTVALQETCTVRISAGSSYENMSGPLKLDLVLEPGTNTYHVHVWDGVGNKAAVVTFTVVSDSVLPLLELTTPEDMERVRRAQVLVTGTTEAGCELLVNGIPAPVLSDGTFAVLVPLVKGANTVTVVATDEAGNTVTRSRQVVLEEPGEEGLSTGAAMAFGLVGGLIGGLVMALVIVSLMQRRQRRRGEDEQALKAWQASAEAPKETPPPREGPPPAAPPEVQAPAAPEGGSQEDEWEAM